MAKPAASMPDPLAHYRVRSVITGVDEVATAMERKWGVGRLPRLVSDELRAKFERQAERFSAAIMDLDAQAVQDSGDAMRRGWAALDLAATQAGQSPVEPDVWEVRLGDGRVVALVRTTVEAHAVAHSGRHVEIWTAEEIARLIEGFPAIAKAKEIWPGATVEEVRARRPIDWKVGDDLPI